MCHTENVMHSVGRKSGKLPRANDLWGVKGQQVDRADLWIQANRTKWAAALEL